MSQKGKVLKLEEPTKTREEFPVIATVRLFKKKDAPANEAKGIILRGLTADGKEDFKQDGYVIWLKGIDQLTSGNALVINSFLVKYQPKPEA